MGKAENREKLFIFQICKKKISTNLGLAQTVRDDLDSGKMLTNSHHDIKDLLPCGWMI